MQELTKVRKNAMTTTIPTISKFGQSYLELRIKGSGKTSKGDRPILLTAKESKMLAYTLLLEAEGLRTEPIKPAKTSN